MKIRFLIWLINKKANKLLAFFIFVLFIYFFYKMIIFPFKTIILKVFKFVYICYTIKDPSVAREGRRGRGNKDRPRATDIPTVTKISEILKSTVGYVWLWVIFLFHSSSPFLSLLSYSPINPCPRGLIGEDRRRKGE